MRMSPLRIRNWVFLFVFCLAIGSLCFYLPASYRHTYEQGDVVFAKVNSLTSFKTLIPLSHYSLPFCRPVMGIRRSRDNTGVGGALMGDQVVNSPYYFRMNVNETKYLCTTDVLSQDDVAVLKERIQEMYQVNMILDSMPVRRYTKLGNFEILWTGFPVGYVPPSGQDVYVINHLKFKISAYEQQQSDTGLIGIGETGMAVISEADMLKSKYEIVGFEVVPCSIAYNPESTKKLHMYDDVGLVNCPLELESSQIVRENERITFTYEVEFVKSERRWSSRWDPYVLKDVKLLQLSIVNSLISIFFLLCIVLTIFSRSIWKELKMNEELGKLAEAADVNSKSLGWKLVVGDAFREPKHSKILCALIGNGVQITVAAIITVALAESGLVMPALRGLVLTQVIMLYLFSGLVGGYVSISLWKTIKRTSEGWLSVSFLAGFLFLGTLFLIHLVINLVLWNSNSTAALSVFWYLALISLWLFVSLPVTLLGGFFAAHAKTIQYPVHVNDVPREIPARRFSTWILVVGSGILPFGILFTQLFFILTSIRMHQNYSAFGNLFMSLLMFIIGCGEVSLIITYIILSKENWRWWWKAFLGSGSVGLYLLLYCVKYLVIDLVGLSGPASVTVYLGYSLIATACVVLSAGSIGFVVSFYFVYSLYSSIKV